MEPQIIIFIVAGAGVAIIAWLISTGNRFSRLDHLMRESWANVDVALKRRHDLIPNLVETVKGFAAHETEVLDRVVEARSKALRGGADDENQLAQAVTMLFARTEAYPQLRSSESFLELQRELVNTEDRIAAARRFFNANVRDYNLLIESFPASLLAGNRKPKEFYEVESIDVRMSPALQFERS